MTNACVARLTVMIARRGVLSACLVALAGCAEVLGITELTGDDPPDAALPPPPPPSKDAAEVPRDAGIDVAPPDADAAGPAWKRVFVTSDRSNGIMGGMAGANGRCAAAAVRASHEGTWVPWLSGEGQNAIDRIVFDGPYRTLDGRTVVSNKAQLVTGNLTNAIDVDETGAKVTQDLLVWTGTSSDGKLFAVCSNWTTNNIVDFGTIGSLDEPKDGLWTDNLGPGGGFRNWGCQTSARIYCFER